jgi:hypothetical protein
MSAFDDFVTAQTAHNASMDASLTDLAGDISNPSAQIQALKDAQGTLTPEQTAALATLTATAETLDSKAAALVAITPPVVPAAP